MTHTPALDTGFMLALRYRNPVITSRLQAAVC